MNKNNVMIIFLLTMALFCLLNVAAASDFNDTSISEVDEAVLGVSDLEAINENAVESAVESEVDGEVLGVSDFDTINESAVESEVDDDVLGVSDIESIDESGDNVLSYSNDQDVLSTSYVVNNFAEFANAVYLAERWSTIYIIKDIVNYDLSHVRFATYDDIVVEGNGHTIDGYGYGGSLIAIFQKGITLRNIVFTNCTTAVSSASESTGNLEHCTFSNSVNRYYDSSIVYVKSSLFNIKDCTFENNVALRHCGSVYILEEGVVNIENCNFRNNQGILGGAIYNEGSLNIQGSTFTDNYAGDNGGAIYSETEFKCQGSKFYSNSANNKGGAIYTVNNLSNEVNGLEFADNYARFGGAIYCEKNINLKSIKFRNNRAFMGGAIYTKSGKINSSTFTNNAAEPYINTTDGISQFTFTYIARENYFNAVYAESGVLEFDCINDNGGTGWNDNISQVNLNRVLDHDIHITIKYENDVVLDGIYNTSKLGEVSVTKFLFKNGYYTYTVTQSPSQYYKSYTSPNSNLVFTGTINVNISDFDRLQFLIDSTDENAIINLTNDYNYLTGDSDLIDGIRIDKNLTINGNFFTIDAGKSSAIFNLTSNKVIFFKNINLVNSNGSAIYSEDSKIIVENSNFTNNTGWNGGAICNSYETIIINSNFTNNTAHAPEGNYGYDCGGAVFGGNAYIMGCNFISNHALEGGAIYLNNSNVNNSLFENNDAQSVGAAYVQFESIMSNSRFVNNTGIVTGAMLCRVPNMSNITFINNHAAMWGSLYIQWLGQDLLQMMGIYLDDEVYQELQSRDCIVKDCKFINNKHIENEYNHQRNDIAIENQTVTITQSIFLNNIDGSTPIYIREDSGEGRANVNYCWFGNISDTSSLINIGSIDNYLILETTPLKMTENTIEVYFVLYNSTTGELINITEVPSDVSFNASSETGICDDNVSLVNNKGALTYMNGELSNDTLTLTYHGSDFKFAVNYDSRGLFTDLSNLIDNADTSLDLSYDFKFNPVYDMDYYDGIKIGKVISIIGNGFCIDGNDANSVFLINSDSVSLNNLTILNLHVPIYWTGDNGTVKDISFENNTGNDLLVVTDSQNMNILKSNFTDNNVGDGFAVNIINSSATVKESFFKNNGKLVSIFADNNSKLFLSKNELNDEAIMVYGEITSETSSYVCDNKTFTNYYMEDNLLTASIKDDNNNTVLVNELLFVDDKNETCGSLNQTTYQLNRKFASGNYTVTVKSKSLLNNVVYSARYIILKFNSSVTIMPIPIITYGESLIVDLSIENKTLSEYVIYDKNGNILKNGSVDNNQLIISNLVAGNHTIKIINFESDAFYEDIAYEMFTVNKANSKITVNITDVRYVDLTQINFDIENRTDVCGVIRNLETNSTIEFENITSNSINIFLDVGQYLLTLSNLGNENYTNCTVETVFNSLKVNSIIRLSKQAIFSYGDVRVNFGVENFTSIRLIIMNDAGDIIFDEDDLTFPFEPDLNVGNYNMTIINQESRLVEQSMDSKMIEVIPAENNIVISAGTVEYGLNTTITVNADADGNYTVQINDEKVIIEVKNGTGNASIPLDVGTYTPTTFFSNENYDEIIEIHSFKVLKANINLEFDLDEIFVNKNVTGKVISQFDGYYSLIFNNTVQIITVVNNVYEFDLGLLADGTYNITVTFNQTDRYNEKTVSATFKTMNVDKTTPNISVASSNVVYPNEVIINLTSDAAGKYVIKIADQSIIIDLNANEMKSVVFKGIKAGIYCINVTFNETENYTSAVNDTVSVSVLKATPTISVSAESTVYPGDLIVNVTGNVGGKYTVKVGNQQKEIDLVANVVGNVAFAGLSAKEYTINVAYAETENYTAALNDTVKVSVLKATPTINVSAENATYSSDVIITVITDAGGKYNITVGNQTKEEILTASTNTITFTGVKVGNYTITVKYAETENYTSAINDTVKVSVLKNEAFEPEITATNTANETVITFTFPEDATGNVTVIVDGKKYNATVENGKAVITMPLIPLDSTVDFEYSGDENYPAKSKKTSINNVTAIIKAMDMIRGYNSGVDYQVTVVDGNGNPIVKKQVIFIINGNKYNATTNDKGIAVLNIKLAIGTHTVTTVNPLNNDNVTKTVKITTRITGNKNVNTYYGKNYAYKLRIIGDDGKPVGSNVAVKVTVNGKAQTLKTDKNGYITLKFTKTYLPKTYTVTAEYKGIKVTNKVNVKQILTLKKVKVKKSAKKLVVKATLKEGKKALKNKKVTFKFKGKKYKAKTNKKGIAKVTIKKSVLKKLKVGKKVKYQVTYLKDTVKRSVKVKK